MVERRHEIEIGDPLGRDQLERARDVEARQADEGAADQRHGEQRAHAHGVIERHGAERALALAIEILRHMRERRGALGALAARHALWAARWCRRCRASPTRLRRRRAAAHRSRRCAEERLEREVLRARVARPRCAGKRLRLRRGAHRLPPTRLLVYDRLGLGVGTQKSSSSAVERQFSGVMMIAGELAGPVDGRRLPAVLQQRDEMIAGREPERVEAGNERRDPPVPVAVGQAHVAVDDRQRLRVARDARQKARCRDQAWRAVSRSMACPARPAAVCRPRASGDP